MTITKTNQTFIDKVALFTKGTQFQQLSEDGAKFTPATLTQALSLWVAEQDDILKRQRKEARAAKKAQKEAESEGGNSGEGSDTEHSPSPNDVASTTSPKKDTQLGSQMQPTTSPKDVGLTIDVDAAEAVDEHDVSNEVTEKPKAKAKSKGKGGKPKVAKKSQKVTLVPEMLDLSGGDDDEEGEEQLYYVNKINDEKWDVYESNDISSEKVCTFNPEDGTME